MLLFFCAKEKKKPLASPYSPNTLRCKYHRRMCVSRPSSEWDGVGPHSFEHEGIQVYDLESLLHLFIAGARCVSRLLEFLDSCDAIKLVWVSLPLLPKPNIARRSSPRVIRTSPLNTLPCLHAWPVNPVVYRDSYPIKGEKSHLGEGFPLRCFQRLSHPYIATQHVPLV